MSIQVRCGATLAALLALAGCGDDGGPAGADALTVAARPVTPE